MAELDLELLKTLGALTKETRKEVSEMVKEGMAISEIINYVEHKIFSKGMLPSFPAMVSVNDMAAHYTIYDEDYILQKGDVIKIDFGFSKNGFMTDNAFTIEIGTNKHQKLIETAKACLDKAMEVVDYGVSMGEIGGAVNEVAEKNGFNTIHNLTGHQIAQYDLHHGLCVPNIDNGDSRKVEENQQFAIEPFVTYGKPLIKAVRPSNILHVVGNKPLRDPIAKKVFDYIKEHFPKQPFSKRWLLSGEWRSDVFGDALEKYGEGFDKRRVNYAVSLLKKYGVLYEYDELGTVDGEIVAQFEDCVVFKDNTKTIITRL
jgi:methionyl aminopeptidase